MTSRRAAHEDPAAFSYSDGFGREIQHKGQAAAGPVTDGGPDVEHRWIGSGWTVFNNKGKPVRKYEPFFTATPISSSPAPSASARCCSTTRSSGS